MMYAKSTDTFHVLDADSSRMKAEGDDIVPMLGYSVLGGGFLVSFNNGKVVYCKKAIQDYPYAPAGANSHNLFSGLTVELKTVNHKTQIQLWTEGIPESGLELLDFIIHAEKKNGDSKLLQNLRILKGSDTNKIFDTISVMRGVGVGFSKTISSGTAVGCACCVAPGSKFFCSSSIRSENVDKSAHPVRTNTKKINNPMKTENRETFTDHHPDYSLIGKSLNLFLGGYF